MSNGRRLMLVRLILRGLAMLRSLVMSVVRLVCVLLIAWYMLATTLMASLNNLRPTPGRLLLHGLVMMPKNLSVW